MKLLIAIPAYNEGHNIPLVINRVKECVPSADILVINDGSIDNTPELAKKSGVILLSHPVNLGYGGAVQTGLKYAQKQEYEIIVLLDADGQHDPGEIEDLVKPIKNGSADVVVGSRFLKPGHHKTNLVRRLGMILFSLLTSLILRQKISDTTSGFQALNQRAVKFLAREYPVDYPDAEVIILLTFSGFKVIEIPITVRPRLLGESMHSTFRSIHYPFRMILAILMVLLRVIISPKSNRSFHRKGAEDARNT